MTTWQLILILLVPTWLSGFMFCLGWFIFSGTPIVWWKAVISSCGSWLTAGALAANAILFPGEE